MNDDQPESPLQTIAKTEIGCAIAEAIHPFEKEFSAEWVADELDRFAQDFRKLI